MTTLQNQYWTLQETKRHNAELEEIQRKEADTKARQAAVSEYLAPSQAAKNRSGVAKDIGDFATGLFETFVQKPAQMWLDLQMAPLKMFKLSGKIGSTGLTNALLFK